MFIPELFHVCLLSMSVNDKSQRAMIRGTLLNTIRATSTPSEASRAQVDRLLTVLSLDGPERPEEDDAALESPEGIVTAMARIDEMCETLVNVLIAIAVNADQANVWRGGFPSLLAPGIEKAPSDTHLSPFVSSLDQSCCHFRDEAKHSNTSGCLCCPQNARHRAGSRQQSSLLNCE